MNYDLKKFTPEYLPTLAKLLDDSFHISIGNKEQLVQWKLLSSVHQHRAITYLAIDPTKNVVSHYTNLPVTIQSQNKKYKSMVCVDMATDKRHRGKGLISQLSEKVYQEVRRNNYEFSIGFSNDEGVQIDKHAKQYGYQLVGKFIRYFKIVITRKKIPLKLIEITNFSKDLKVDGLSFFSLNKNYNYLNWRYILKPSHEYEVYKIVENTGTEVGFVVLRFLNAKCYIYDIVMKDFSKEKLLMVLRSIENKSLDKGIRIIVYNVLDNKFWQELFNRYKYFKRANNNVNYYLTIKLHKKLREENELLDKENWFLMNGDII